MPKILNRALSGACPLEDAVKSLDNPETMLKALRVRIKDLAAKNGLPEPHITPAAMRLLEQYAWPGNVRELRNTIERMVVLSTNGTLDENDVPDALRTAPAATPLSATVTLGENEKAQILAVLKECGGNRSEAARKLGISRRTIYRKLDEYAKDGSLT